LISKVNSIFLVHCTPLNKLTFYIRKSPPFVNTPLKIEWNYPLWVHFKSLESSLLLFWFLSWETFSSDESSCTYLLVLKLKVACSFPFLTLNPSFFISLLVLVLPLKLIQIKWVSPSVYMLMQLMLQKSWSFSSSTPLELNWSRFFQPSKVYIKSYLC